MKKFVVGFILGTLIMVVAGQFWGLMPTFLGGSWDTTQPNPITSNPITLWCNNLNGTSGRGKVEAAVTQNSQPVSDLTVLLSVEEPPLVPYPADASGKTMIPFPRKACAINTNLKGVGTFSNVPTGTAYVFFNNDAAAYPKRFGSPNFSITPVKVNNGETSTVNIELNPKR